MAKKKKATVKLGFILDEQAEEDEDRATLVHKLSCQDGFVMLAKATMYDNHNTIIEFTYTQISTHRGNGMLVFVNSKTGEQTMLCPSRIQSITTTPILGESDGEPK